jgi:CubicO group peptidase (beta-lactamase class C family)
MIASILAVVASIAWARAPTIGLAAEPLPGLEPFVDGIMGTAMRDETIPGGVVVIVKDGKILLKKGYGFADIEAGRKVDPDRTLFRIASMSKLFVATSVMQLVEQGRIDLDAPADRYLERPLRLRYSKPVTVRNLITHTAGFEDAYTGIFDAPGTVAPPLQTVIDTSLPRQAFPPGTWPAYSNHGFVVLGRIVERVSGQTYADYVEQHVLAPLEMRNSTAHQPVPPGLRAQVVTGYDVEHGNPIARPFETVSASPGGGLSLSGADMAKFMLFELGDGPPILSRASRLRMQSPAFRVNPAVNAIGLAVPLQTLNGRAAFYHTGALDHAGSRVTFLPGERFAIYVAFNSGQANGADADVVDQVLDRYFPDPSPPPPRAPDPDMARYDGAYQTTGSFWVTPPALSAAATQTFVSHRSDGLMMLNQDGAESLWFPIGGGRFHRIGVDKSMAGDLVFLFKPGDRRPYGMARTNVTTRISLRREGIHDIRVTRLLITLAAIGAAAIAFVLTLRVVAALRRMSLGLGAALVGLIGAEAIMLHFSLVYGVGNGAFQDGDRLSLSLPTATIVLLTEPYVALGLGICGLASAVVFLAADNRRRVADWAPVGGWGLLAIATGIFLWSWRLLF